MKIFLILVVLISCILIGVFISNYYKKRKQFLSELLSFVLFLKTYVKYGSEKLIVVIDKFGMSSCNNFNVLIKKYKELIKNNIDKQEFEKFIDVELNFLKDNEKKMISEIFISLGSFDEICELNNLEIYKNTLENFVKISTNESNKFSPFAIKISLLVGSLLFIIFI